MAIEAGKLMLMTDWRAVTSYAEDVRVSTNKVYLQLDQIEDEMAGSFERDKFDELAFATGLPDMREELRNHIVGVESSQISLSGLVTSRGAYTKDMSKEVYDSITKMIPEHAGQMNKHASAIFTLLAEVRVNRFLEYCEVEYPDVVEQCRILSDSCDYALACATDLLRLVNNWFVVTIDYNDFHQWISEVR